MENQQIEIVNEISYLGVATGSSKRLSKNKAKQRIKENQYLVAVGKCLTKTLILEWSSWKMYMHMKWYVSQARLMYGVGSMAGGDEGWNKVDKIHGKLYQKKLGNPKFCSKWRSWTRVGKSQQEGQGTEFVGETFAKDFIDGQGRISMEVLRLTNK